MNPLLPVVLAAGLAAGSFVNVVVARLPRGGSVVRPRSACPACAQQIAWYDNVPLVSYAVLHGRCRRCRQPFGVVYPALEAGTALLWGACLLAFGATPYAAVAALFCTVLVALSAIDAEHRVVPNRIVLPAALAVLAARTAIDPGAEWALAAVAAAGALLAVALAYPGGLGMGDVKLCLLLGAMLGRGVAVALAAGLLAAFVPAVWLLVRDGRAARKAAIPLAPFLALGALVALFAGDALLDAYLRLL